MPRPPTRWHHAGALLARTSAVLLLVWTVLDLVQGYLRTGGARGVDLTGLMISGGLLVGHELLARRLRAGRGEIGAPIVFATELGLFGTAIGFMVWYGTATAGTFHGVMAVAYLLCLAVGTLVGLRLLFGLWFGRRD